MLKKRDQLPPRKPIPREGGYETSVGQSGAQTCEPRYSLNATTPGALTAYSTLISAGFEWLIAGDDNNNCAVTLEYRMLGSTTWKPAQPLLRVEHGIWTHGEDPGNMLAGSLFFLNPGTTYEARLTLADPHTHDFERSRTLATDADDLLDTMVVAKDLPAAGAGDGPERGFLHTQS